jgi:arabinogalactan endo-1,4-beta-galactosidase
MIDTNKPFIVGADLSMLDRILVRGDRYSLDGQPVDDVVSLFRQSGFDWARLRLFHSPSGHGAQCNDLAYTLKLAKTLHTAGYKLLLDLHYSDTWADPGKQYTPKAWAGLSFSELEQAVYEYTVDVLKALAKEGIRPEMVQVGNEITPGMLWEHGRVADAHSTNTVHWQQNESSNNKEAWGRFGKLLKAGVSGVRDTLGTASEIMLHIDRGGDIETNRWFFDNILEQGIDFQAIGESYYPFWHGMPDQLAETLDFLGKRYGKDLYLAEVAYPHCFHEMYKEALSGDQEGWEKLTRKYPLSPEGQEAFLRDVATIVQKSSHGRGLFYWAPEWIPPQVPGVEDEGDAPACWARSLFDAKGNALPALNVFKSVASAV